MLDSDSITVPDAFGRHHVLAGVLAAAFSVGIHIGAFYLLPGLRFSLARFPDRLPPPLPERIPMKVIDVQPGPEVLEAWPKLVARGAIPVPSELRGEAERLAVQPAASVMDPPALAANRVPGAVADAAGPEAPPARPMWQPRQEILAIDRAVADPLRSALPRRRIPRIERVAAAPDIVAPVERRMVGKLAPPGTRLNTLENLAPGAVRGGAGPTAAGGASATEAPRLWLGDGLAERSGDLYVVAPGDITTYRPIERLLQARATTYATLRDFRFTYFRIEIERSGPQALPVMPKDIVFVQDCSASMSEQRLYFCRQGLELCLAAMKEGDRFNIIAFRDRAERCFPGWAPPDAASLDRAKTFIRGLAAGGRTDIYASMRELVDLAGDRQRPVLALLVTDGLSTAGLTDSSDIIGEFSKLNDGAISVFSLAAAQTADMYLLDLLSYCNRGDAEMVRGGRWGIAEQMQARMAALSRPVLTDVRCRFAGRGDVEVYPVQSSNLYLDRALVLYGRCPRGTEEVVFQVLGQALDIKCDMVFSVGLGREARSDDAGIREMWAKQKIYHLIGRYAREPREQTLNEIKSTARAYDVAIPHRGRF